MRKIPFSYSPTPSHQHPTPTITPKSISLHYFLVYYSPYHSNRATNSYYYTYW